MKVTTKDVEYIAQLSRLTIPEGEMEKFTEQFNQILNYADILLAKPRSVSIDVVIRKKISNIKAISAVELELIPGTALFFLAILLTLFFNC